MDLRSRDWKAAHLPSQNFYTPVVKTTPVFIWRYAPRSFGVSVIRHPGPGLTSSNHIEGPVLQTAVLNTSEIKRIRSILGFSRNMGMSTGKMASTAHADSSHSSELWTAESTRPLQNTGLKPGQQIFFWEAEAGESLTR